MSLVRVLVVDDFEPWQAFTVGRLEQRPDLRVIGVASNGLEAVRKAEALQPDLILLDISLPRLNGIEAARQIRKVASKSKVLFLSSNTDPDVVRAAFSAGGQGYVLKSAATGELMAGVDAVVRGEQFVSHGLDPSMI
jgi:two-component system, NarL family, nitrate/nitrite response regulator NarL